VSSSQGPQEMSIGTTFKILSQNPQQQILLLMPVQ